MLKDFPPSYFSLVMATGIVSLACHLVCLQPVALGLFWLNILQYALCLSCSLYRLARYPRLMWQDLTHHARGPGFLTLVAGSNVLGVQFIVLANQPAIAQALWLLAGPLWLLCMYAMLAGVTLTQHKPTLEQGLNGTWLLCTVSSASVCVLGSYLATRFTDPELILFVCVAAYMVGIMLYVLIMSQILYRWLFLDLEAGELSPSYWINMGALAISTLAGARLLTAGADSVLVQSLAPFILGLSVFVGAFACWWIPFLLLVFVTHRVRYGIGIHYDLQNWSVVFPLGMFCVASFNFLPLVHQQVFLPLIQVVAYIALAAWALTFIGLLRHCLHISARIR